MKVYKDGPLLEVRDLKKHFPTGGNWFGARGQFVYAVNGVSFAIGRGETLGLVGESGCGKSTTARAVLGLTKPTDGEVILEGRRIDSLRPAQLRDVHRDIQVVFQDPFSSLNPRMTAADNVAEPLRNFKIGSRNGLTDRVAELFERVGLRPDQMSRYPHEFSGGQRQRIGIARALAISPKLIICDEPVSALDVSVQAQVINLLTDLQEELGISYLFVAHDLAVVEHISDRVAVMYLGEIVEIADKDQLFSRPRHPYTEALLAAVPKPDPTLPHETPVLKGDLPSPSAPPSGCRFHNRCPIAIDRCKVDRPRLQFIAGDHAVACHLRAPAENRVSA